MAARYYICGQIGSGTKDDPYRPEIADEPGVGAWAANQELESSLPVVALPRFVVAISDPSGALHTALAYDATSNPNGYEWLEVADDGTVTVNA